MLRVVRLSFVVFCLSLLYLFLWYVWRLYVNCVVCYSVCLEVWCWRVRVMEVFVLIGMSRVLIVWIWIWWLYLLRCLVCCLFIFLLRRMIRLSCFLFLLSFLVEIVLSCWYWLSRWLKSVIVRVLNFFEGSRSVCVFLFLGDFVVWGFVCFVWFGYVVLFVVMINCCVLGWVMMYWVVRLGWFDVRCLMFYDVFFFVFL